MQTLKSKRFYLPVADLGADKMRLALIPGSARNGIIKLSMERPVINVLKNPKTIGDDDITDLKLSLEAAAGAVKQMIQHADREVVPVFSFSSPGAWNTDGTSYPGTMNNFSPNKGYKLAEEFSQMLGTGWKSYINNDGILQGLVLGKLLLANIGKFNNVLRAFHRSPKLAVFIPGSGFGAGAFSVNIPGNKIEYFPGPQQFYDIILQRDHPGIVSELHLTAEDFIAGLGIKALANSGYYGREGLSALQGKKFTGLQISELALSGEPSLRQEAQEALMTAGRKLACLMLLTKLGNGKKTDVIVPESIERTFWEQVRGTEAFILGGWLLSEASKRFLLPVTHKVLSRSDLSIVTSDELPGAKALIESDSVGLWSAPYQVPESEISNHL